MANQLGEVLESVGSVKMIAPAAGAITEDGALADLSEYEPLLRTLLLRRGIITREAAQKFLQPDYDTDIHDPFLILNMDRAVDRILKAIANNEFIILFTDYDTDGIPAGVILYDFFTKIGYTKFRNYIPHRHTEGYGLNMAAIEAFANPTRDNNNGSDQSAPATLMITADCGISNVAEVARAQELGIDVILTDHHLPHDVLPAAYAILNSKQSDDTYPFDMLCGAAVAFKLITALMIRGRERGTITIHDGWEKWLLDMVGISTVSDMVPLVGENRVLAHYGLKVLRKSPRPGLQKLLSKLSVDQRYLTEEDIGFTIGPRINAASRMDIPFRAFELLSTREEVAADTLSDHLNGLNDKRKKLVAQIMKESHERLGASSDEVPAVIVIGSPLWQPGVLGLAANKLAEEYDRPTFIWGRGEESVTIKGSCRSDGRINVVELMTAARDNFKDAFIDFGGHEFAGGFSVSGESIHFLEQALISAHAQVPKMEALLSQQIDAELTVEDISWQTFKILERLAPFGTGNARPVFLFRNLIVSATKFFGKERNHLSLILRGSGDKTIEAISFFAKSGGSEKTAAYQVGEHLDVTAYIEKNAFFKRPELRLRIISTAPVVGE